MPHQREQYRWTASFHGRTSTSEANIRRHTIYQGNHHKRNTGKPPARRAISPDAAGDADGGAVVDAKIMGPGRRALSPDAAGDADGGAVVDAKVMGVSTTAKAETKETKASGRKILNLNEGF